MSTQEALVFKVKYGDNIKRINGFVNHEKILDMNLAQLRSKIRECFKITTDKVFDLTYIDEDGDQVLLGDDADLFCAAIEQELNPLRIDIKLIHTQLTPPPPPPPQNPPAKFNPDHNRGVKSLGKDVNQKLKIPSVKKPSTPAPLDKPPSHNIPKQDQVEPSSKQAPVDATSRHAPPSWNSVFSPSTATVWVHDGVFFGGQFVVGTPPPRAQPVTGGQVVANPSTFKNATAVNVMPGSPANIAATKTHAINVQPTAGTENPKVINKPKVPMFSRPHGMGKWAANFEVVDDVLEDMVEELVDMGYGDKDLNREVLRSNNYDLDQAFDASEYCTSEDSCSDDTVLE